MAWLEISTAKIWSLFKEEVAETYDEKMADKLMKFALSTAKNFDDYAIETSTLKRMKKFVDTRLKFMGEE